MVNVTFKSTGQLASTRMVDAAMSPSDIQPELHLLRTSTALPSLRRLPSLQPLAARQTPTGSAQYVQGRPDVVRNSETAVRRRADLDEPALLHVHNRGPRIPDLLSGAAGATTGRPATAGPRFEHHRSKVDSAILFLSQTLHDREAHQRRVSDDTKVQHMFDVRAELTRPRGDLLSPSKVEPSVSSTASSASFATGSMGVSQLAGSPYSRQAGIVPPTRKHTKANLPSMQFSRRSQQSIVPDLEVPPVFMTPSERQIRGAAGLPSGESASGTERRLSAHREAIKTDKSATSSRLANNYEGWASRWWASDW